MNQMFQKKPDFFKIFSYIKRLHIFVCFFLLLGSMPLFAKPVHVEGVHVPSFSDLVKKVSPAVVSVRVKAKVKENRMRDSFQMFESPEFDFLPDNHPLKRFFDEFYNEGRTKRPNKGNKGHGRNLEKVRPIAQGSGFFISEDGYIVTNNHVIQGGQEFTIVLHDLKEYKARLIGADSRTDIALLKIDSDKKFTYVDFAEDKSIYVGDWVLAVGNAFGFGGTVTAGIISARGRDIGSGPYDDFIQIDAAVNYGNSGGPAFNLKGQVVGVNTAIFSTSGGNIGIAFAIPGSTVSHIVKNLKKDGSISRGWLGIKIQPVTEEISESIGLKKPNGAIISEIDMDGPSKKAGIQVGDVIVAVNDKEIPSPKELSRIIGDIKPGTIVEVTVWRNEKNYTLKIKLGILPNQEKGSLQNNSSEQQGLEELGLTVLNAENQGLTVVDIDPDSISAERGIQMGDILVAINSVPIKTIKDVTDQIQNAEKAGRKSVLIQINRNHVVYFVSLPIPSKVKQ